MAEPPIFVAPWGDDTWPGTVERPLATVFAAQRAVRARTATMTGDLVVHLRAGTYHLDRTLEFRADQGDSGTGGHHVRYQPHRFGTAEQETVVLSGGRAVTGWTPGADGVWTAPVGDLDVRQLHVDGRRAGRAAHTTGIPGNVTKTETGYVTDSSVPLSWHGADGIEFVYPGVYPWSEARCAVAGITATEHGTTITMAQPAWDWARRLYDAEWHGATSEDGDQVDWVPLANPPLIENSRSFLTEPGTFVLDRSTPGQHVLHYLPLPGEHPERTEVVVPVLETLVAGSGTEQHPLTGLTLRGLTFAHAGWSGIRRTGGYLHYHGVNHYLGGGLTQFALPEGMGRVTVPTETARLPANVEFTHVARLALVDNHFTHLGAGGLSIGESSVDVLVRGNTFTDISGSGITVADSADCVIEDNLVHDIGREYRGSPAIALSQTRDAIVRHNEIHHVPHNGIVVTGGERARGTQVVANLIHHTMTALADGGGIYVSAPQGASFASGAVIRGNVIHDTVTSYNFGLYTDYGAAWVTVLGNAIHRGDTPVVLQVSPPLRHVAFLGNFWDAEPSGHDTPPDTVVVAGNTVLPGDDFTRALAADPAGADILATAGRRTATGQHPPAG